MSNQEHAWDYFQNDPHYSDVLKQRLAEGIEMDSAKAMGNYLDGWCHGDLRVLDFGGGPGHYYPVIRKAYSRGTLQYTSIDIDTDNIAFGKAHFRDDPNARFEVGSVLTPDHSYDGHNCLVSANTLPHVPSIEPLLNLLRTEQRIQFFVFRMLIGQECVQIKKHLKENDFDQLYEAHFQFNNIYSQAYLKSGLGDDWELVVKPDVFDVDRLAGHRLPAQDLNPFYQNRVSRPVNGMIFKGDVYMPWRFVLGRRKLRA
jgi:SAM-dependent methyltransferase